MTTMITTNNPLPRLNTLAACLALVFSSGVGANSTLSVQATVPRSNHSAADQLRTERPRGVLNRAHRRAPSHAPASRNGVARPAATFTVTNCLDDGSAGSLRSVLALATTAADVVDMSSLTCSKITLVTGALAPGDGVILQGPGQDKLSIDGNAADSVVHADGSLTVNALTITNGNYAYGGCLDISGDLHLVDTTVRGCVAGGASSEYAYGAGVDVRGSLTMKYSTLRDNTASGSIYASGGGGYAGAGLSIANSTITGNSVINPGGTTHSDIRARGGGLAIRGGPAYIAQSLVSNNTVSSTDGVVYGGGIFAEGGHTGPDNPGMALLFSTVSGNTAHSTNRWSYGAGMAVGLNTAPAAMLSYFSTLRGNTVSSDCADCTIQGGGASVFGQVGLLASTVSGNKAVLSAASTGAAYGGGVATRLRSYNGTDNVDFGSIESTESTISGNAAGSGAGGSARGGGLAALLSPLVIGNTTVTLNTATSSGGGMIEFGAAPGSPYSTTLVSSVVAGNVAPIGADLATFSTANVVTYEGSNNLVMSAQARIVLPADTLMSNPMLLPLNCNGGFTQTHGLGAGSPAIDAGVSSDTKDQRGDPFVRLSGSAVDIGAFEVQPAPDFIFQDGFDNATVAQACAWTTWPI